MSVSAVPTTGAVHIVPQVSTPAPTTQVATKPVSASDKKSSSKRLLDVTA